MKFGGIVLEDLRLDLCTKFLEIPTQAVQDVVVSLQKDDSKPSTGYPGGATLHQLVPVRSIPPEPV